VWTSSCHNGRNGCICKLKYGEMFDRGVLHPPKEVTLNPKCTLTGHSSQVTSVAYSPDGKHIVSGSCDDTVKIWDAHSGKEVRVVV
jgi:WD40 repeat protein